MASNSRPRVGTCIVRPRLNIVSTCRLTFALVILALSLSQLWNSSRWTTSTTGLNHYDVVSPIVLGGGGIQDEQVVVVAILERQQVLSSKKLDKGSSNQPENIENSLRNHPEAAAISSSPLTISTIQSPSSFVLSPATKCRLELQHQTARILVEDYVHKGRPFLQNVVQLEREDGVYQYVVILSFTPFTKWRKVWYTRQPQVLWKCHYSPGSSSSSLSNETTVTVAAQMVKREGDSGPDIILTCPRGHNNTTQQPQLDMVSFTHPFNPDQNLAYNVSGYRICDELMAREGPTTTTSRQQALSSSTTVTPSTPVVKIAAMTSIRGSQARALVEPWVEYHRLVGVDHFWIFINDHWDTALGRLPIRQYITYVPCDYCRTSTNTSSSTLPFHVCASGRNHWQQGQNLEALYRAKQYNLDWLLLIDVDEYLHVVPPNNNNSTIQSTTGNNKPLRDFIDTTQNNYANKNDSIAGFYFKSIPFGRNAYNVSGDNETSTAATTEFANHQTTTPTATNDMQQLLLDYTWRSNRTWDDYTWGRRKQLIQPRHVRSVGVHDILSQHIGGHHDDDNNNANTASTIILWLDAATQMRLHHYKNPHLGVFEPDGKVRRRAKRKGQSSLVQDATLVYAFRDPVVAAMATAAALNNRA
jgi:Glycosyl transferase family 2